MRTIKVGSRDSLLAVAQTKLVMDVSSNLTTPAKVLTKNVQMITLQSK